MTTIALQKTPAPIQIMTPRCRETTAKIELSAEPGTLLGGALCCTPKQGCQLVGRDELPQVHLTYLRSGYADSHSPLRRELNLLARTYKYGCNQLAVYALDECVAQNVIRAIEGIAAKLPDLEFIN